MPFLAFLKDNAPWLSAGVLMTLVSSCGQTFFISVFAAEIMGEAMLGTPTVECNWLMLALDCSMYQEAPRLQEIAEEILDELRTCPPAPGFDKVEVPGEREADARARNAAGPILLPSATWAKILQRAEAAGVPVAG